MRNVKDLRDEGFTLIELLIVVVVLGVLAGIVILSLGSIQSSAWVSDCQSDGANVNLAIQDYLTKNGTYPASPTDLLTTDPANGAPYIGSWPNQTSHYTFTIAPAHDGTFTVSSPQYLAGITWVGAKTCSSPLLKLQ